MALPTPSFWTFHCLECETITFCRFKPLSWWYFVMAKLIHKLELGSRVCF